MSRSTSWCRAKAPIWTQCAGRSPSMPASACTAICRHWLHSSQLPILALAVLLIAGTSISGDDAAPEAHGFALYFWPGPGHIPVKVGDITTPRGGKAEGLLVRAESDVSISVLLLFDGANNGAPTQISVLKPRTK